MPIQSINPATGEVLRTFTPISDEALRVRIGQAAEAAATQRALPLEHRALCLRKLGSLLDEESPEHARTISQETGKPLRAAEAEIARCVDAARFYAEQASRLLAPELLQSENGQSYVQWSPMGVVLAVMPWESPFWHVLRFAIPALAAGNTILLKHAASVPQCALQIEALVRRAGFSRGTLSALLIDSTAVNSVLGDERVAAVTVTGSESTGRAVAAQAGWLLKKSALHLPGSDPLVVMPSADLDAAVAAAVRALATGSQATRLVIHSGVYNDFLHRLVTAVEALQIGDPLKDGTEVGPLGTADALNTLAEQVAAAVTSGGRIVTGGTRLVGRGNFFEPTILSDLPRTAVVARDALAGPVALVFRAKDLTEAIAIANDTPFGRAASVWTKEPGEQQQLIAGIHVGTVALNALPTDNARAPIGGTKRSGYGRELGEAGIREFMVAKTVLIGQ
ncbi:NAD-dependent aldehyde dehydrogenase [Terriglobus roseus DSM 18391]|uniref:NAD-dependent aldehyde dehydrogenase n=1 Tax=Terriglobus roseus (strain DSM 18391 / NRRL B-41598 / KBS 63) TaxID=926566 RepID=I3ZD69_TERRK|nr:aldehyde dehydrogenase family protein [Terriglobus roseus]AFL87187.1 NAD-dependent aldehyde dehydrogenase [Terriglobus roseus DSM 18391]